MISSGNLYLERYADQRQLWPLNCDSDTRLFVVIPAFRESDLLQTLESLSQCDPPGAGTEILVVINQEVDAGEETTRINNKAFQEVTNWIANDERKNNSKLSYLVSYVNDLTTKQAGVGMARKIGMDQVIRRIEAAKIPADEAILICFDADCTCEPNYLKSIESHFLSHPETPGASIYYEHPVTGPEPARLYLGIALYESFLRYYVDGLRYAGYPYAFQTVGSSMVVRADAYQKQGGMNKRKAGEDFYFLQRIFPLGNYTEINDTCVFPSPRVSEKVPFGTGKAMKEWMSSPAESFPVYHHQTFVSLKQFIAQLHTLFSAPSDEINQIVSTLPESMQSFLNKNDFVQQFKIIKKATTTYDSFLKRFFQWFSGLKVLKYVHHCRDLYYGEEEVVDAVCWLLENFYRHDCPDKDPFKLLTTLRDKDRS